MIDLNLLPYNNVFNQSPVYYNHEGLDILGGYMPQCLWIRIKEIELLMKLSEIPGALFFIYNLPR